MSDPRDRNQEHYRWTAYLKLKGQTRARREEEIMVEFDGFVQSLRGVGVDYNIIVLVEGKAPRQICSEHNSSNTEAGIAREGTGA